MTAQGARAADTYESAKSGTIYWTLSLYIEADRAAAALGLKPGTRIAPETFRRMQRSHRPSLALANAIDPLMNDIADRETQGEVQEFLLAVTNEDVSDMDEAAAAARRYDDLVFKTPKSISWTTEGVRFEASPPGLDREREVQLRRFWLSHNNGALSYHLSFSHFYGAFEDEARDACSGYAPSTYYFLSLLQKLAAPKEYGLDAEILEDINRKTDPYIDVFAPAPLGIDPLDNIEVRYRHPEGERGEHRVERFWPFVRTMFEADSEVLFDRLVRTDQLVSKDEADRFTLKVEKDGYTDALVELVPFIEVPGLKVPKSRFMFMLHDERFFDRLMPLDADRKESVSRKAMVRQDCYEPYEMRIGALMDEASRRRSRSVRLDEDYWTWVCTRPEYDAALDEGAFARAVPDVPAHDLRSDDDTHWSPIRRQEGGDETDQRSTRNPLDELVTAMRAGECFQRYAFDDSASSRPLSERALPTPVKHHVPAFEAHRADCLDYLFLAGFNQNIIDFMNQDTSEILDSIDPIYPDSSDQSSDRFFVRYANHRAMITYVPKSRSLETGNDYIGACPYAFLIHVLALHNEFLARSHEQKTMTRIERIEALIYDRALPDTPAIALLEKQEPLDEDDDLSRAEMAINQAKLAEFSQYERFRYANPFRYETERGVFKTLEELRGISRKKEALALAIKSLEDHASDLSRRQQIKLEEQRRIEERAKKERENESARRQKALDEDAARRGLWLNILLGMTGFFGAGQMFYWIGEKAAGPDAGGPPHPTAFATLFGHLTPSTAVGNVILAGTEIVMTLALLLFLAMLGYILWDARAQIAGLFAGLWRKLRMTPTEAGRQTTKPRSTPVGTGLDSSKD